ncbi:acyltransferase family protein [Urbifossiella limnaea]|uniref:O-acetyltransferase OatA n=1 Tax=Urbifossiella limnaea TaxID=2528023 RepID=A0A517Y2X1_9BACT|nr:acyltransferase [Urbifossiella limnaea]QDU24150.1 O-acetyltransferase OatA [Urbifossiella limnaea]
MLRSRTGPEPDWLSRGRIPALDGLRAVAVLLVCLAHAHRTTDFPSLGPLHRLGSIGSVGVDIFFVLSGFLITTLLLREHEQTGRTSLGGFYLRRSFRILPAYVCFMAFVAALSWYGFAKPSAWDWAAAVTYTMNFVPRPAWELGHLWSLSVEEHFYLIWPVTFLVVPRRALPGVLAGTLALGPLARLAVLIWWPAEARMTDLWTFTRLDSIAAGCLVAVLARSPLGFRTLDVLGRWWPAAFVLLVAGLAAGTLSGKMGILVTPTVVALTLGVLVWAAARRAPRWLEARVMVAVGVGSYSLYLWQQPFLNPHCEGWYARFPQNLILAGSCALASYWLVEKPFLRIKSRLEARGRSGNTPAPAPDGLSDVLPASVPSDPRGAEYFAPAARLVGDPPKAGMEP